MQRHLAFDFPADVATHNIGDQFLWGSALLVAPISQFGQRTRAVYLPALPAGNWTDFYSGQTYAGGQTITADAPITQIPLFIRAGSILTLGPFLQYSSEKPTDPLELRVCAGVSGSAQWYQDDGTTLAYQQGAYSLVPIFWNDSARTLTLASRLGSLSLPPVTVCCYVY